ncbi:MAG: hypothetical protein WC840_03220 [Candidatus Peribacteraceae bacterium]
MVIDHQREAEPLREVLNLLLHELNSLCHRHQSRTVTTNQDGNDEIGGAAAFRLCQLSDLAEWIEKQLEENPLDMKAIGQHQMELSSLLVGCGRKDLLPTLLCSLGTSEAASRQEVQAAPILSTIEQCSWGASDVLRLSSSQPHILHYLILQARDENAAQEAWRQLRQCEEYLSADILVHIILNSGFRGIVQDAWVLVRSRKDLTRRSLESLASSAPLPEIREQAQTLIEE